MSLISLTSLVFDRGILMHKHEITPPGSSFPCFLLKGIFMCEPCLYPWKVLELAFYTFYSWSLLVNAKKVGTFFQERLNFLPAAQPTHIYTYLYDVDCSMWTFFTTQIIPLFIALAFNILPSQCVSPDFYLQQLLNSNSIKKKPCAPKLSLPDA